MSSKTTTNTQNQYNPAGLGNYNSFQGSLGSILPQLANNPLGSSYFNQQLAQSMGTANQLGQRNISNTLSNLRAGGGILSNGGGLQQGLLQNATLANSGLQSSAFNSSLSSALNNRNFALQAMEGYNPLQTGSTTTQTQSQGVGSILGSVAGIGLSAALPGVGSLLGGGAFSDGYGGAGQLGGTH